MRDGQIIRGFQEHDNVINQLHRRVKEIEKGTDKVYLQNLTHVMMWDVLFGLLEAKGIMTKTQFDEALKELSEKTKAAMEAEEADQANGKTTVLSDVPAIPVIK